MPQMSPLGWLWLVIFVSMIYYFVMTFFYYVWEISLSFDFGVSYLSIYNWLW